MWKTRLKSSSLSLPSHSMYITASSAPNTAHPPSWLYFSPLGLSLYNTVSALHLIFLIAFCVSHKMHSTRERTCHCLIHSCVPNSRLQTMLPYDNISPGSSSGIYCLFHFKHQMTDSSGFASHIVYIATI